MHRTDLALDQCALFKVRSPRHLAEILRLECADLKGLASHGKENYRLHLREMGGNKPPRLIEGPSELLKRVQRRIHKLLAQILPPEFLYSGVRGRSAVTNALRHSVSHAASVPMVKLDITKFYPSSDGRRIQRFFFHPMQCSSEVAELLCDLTTIPPTSVSDHDHLPTGGVTSQILAYYGYQEMFEALANLAKEHGVVLGVLVDDVAFSGHGATRRLLNEARLIIQRFGLHSKRSKEKVWHLQDAKLITGVVLTKAGARLPNSRRQAIHQLYQSLHAARLPEDRAILAQRLLGALYSAGQIEGSFMRQGHALHRRLKADRPTWDAMHERSKQHHNHSRLEISPITRFTERATSPESGQVLSTTLAVDQGMHLSGLEK